jgi:hypothetical protein
MSLIKTLYSTLAMRFCIALPCIDPIVIAPFLAHNAQYPIPPFFSVAGFFIHGVQCHRHAHHFRQQRHEPDASITKIGTIDLGRRNGFPLQGLSLHHGDRVDGLMQGVALWNTKEQLVIG